MSFYVKSTPEVAEYFKSKYQSKYNFYVVIGGNLAGKDDVRTFIGGTTIKELKMVGVPEYKLHPKHGLVPAYYSDVFLDNAPEDWSSSESLETKQQNEKPNQKEGNENMDRKEDFPVVGEKVVIDPNLITYCSVLKDCLGREVLVIAKYKYYNIDMVSVCLDEFSGVACVRADCCLPIKTEREKEIESIADVLYASEGDYLKIAQYLYEAGLRFK